MDINMPVQPSELEFLCESGQVCRQQQLICELQDRIAQLTSQVRTDALTQLYNYRFFAEALPLEMERSRRNGQPLGLVLIDIDHFKSFNDTHGHEAGNAALRTVADTLLRVLRKLDFACRYGGEEFALILPNTALAHAINVATRVREAIAETPVVWGGQSLSITASIGVDAIVATSQSSAGEFIAQADHYLYAAKALGRNRINHPPLPVQEAGQTQVTDAEKTWLFAAFDAGHNFNGSDKDNDKDNEISKGES